ncbi:glycosyltransferase family 2 protein [Janibacter massiliensis]|uniref:glycosyltransferase family 2 protein n=1 Tax=Janibacter massiliensis TaxID=2058291 RepID=UPI00131A55CD|nr:glycosyltransferase family 2 protein [Janibacter massiliensis]
MVDLLALGGEMLRAPLVHARQLRWYQRYRADSRNAAVVNAVAEAMDMPRVPRLRRGSVVLVTTVRNELDVIDELVEHHLSQGIEHLVIADNMSSDGTRERLDELSRRHRGAMTVGDDRLDRFYQGAKLSFLARLAWASGARWIVPADADERWMGSTGTLAEHLGSTRSSQVSAVCHNVYPRRDGSWQIDLYRHPITRIAFRAYPALAIGEGAHQVRRPGELESGLHFIHVPWRSRSQLARKTRQGAAALAAAGLCAENGVDGHWYEMAQSGRLDEIWASIEGTGSTSIGYGYKPVGPLTTIKSTSYRSWAAVEAELGPQPTA